MPDLYRYQQIVQLIEEQISNGTLRPGDKLPSLRRLADQLDMSVPTVRQGYIELERIGKVEARDRSGFFVRSRSIARLDRMFRTSAAPQSVLCCNLMEQVYDGIHRKDMVPFGIANPSMAAPATLALHRAMRRIMSRTQSRSLDYASTNGELALRRMIAYRYLEMGGQVSPDDIIITNGGQEALTLALMAVARPGDLIAVESPTYHGLLELIESLGMLAVQIDTCPATGLCLDSLKNVLDKHDIAACMFSGILNNPLGSEGSEKKRTAIIELLRPKQIPLLEDDVYGDLLFDGTRPRPSILVSDYPLVLSCGSFSKTVAPGYRIGWLTVGDRRERISRLKRSISCSSGLLQQLTLADFLATGEYDRHLRRLVPVLRCNAERMACMVSDYFPQGTEISDPKGGSVLWIRLPDKRDGTAVFRAALDAGISITPGAINAPGDQFRDFIRLSYGHPWEDSFEHAIRELGVLVGKAPDYSLAA